MRRCCDVTVSTRGLSLSLNDDQTHCHVNLPPKGGRNRVITGEGSVPREREREREREKLRTLPSKTSLPRSPPTPTRRRTDHGRTTKKIFPLTRTRECSLFVDYEKIKRGSTEKLHTTFSHTSNIQNKYSGSK